MTISEKILAAHAGKPEVQPGQLLFAKVDLSLATDIVTALTVRVFEEMGGRMLTDPDTIVLVNDHYVPAKDIASAKLSKTMREFACRYDIKNYYEVGRAGICHVLLPEEGHVLPGDLIIGADSHTCTYGAVGAFATGVGSTDLAAAWALGELWFRVPETIRVNFWGKLPRWVTGKDLILKLLGEIGVEGALYKALEFGGDTMAQVDMAGRFTICNMAVEAGAKTGIVEPDALTERYVERRATRPYTLWHSDRDSAYCQSLDFSVEAMEPLVARPFSPDNVVSLGSLGNVEIDQVVIGSCTNGRLEDLRLACEAMHGRKVHPRVRVIVVPGSQRVLALAISEGLVSRLVAAGAIISPPTCGPCLGGHMGVLADRERCLSTTNRNFVGRMGDPSSEVYLSGPAVAGASAVLGRIAHPEEV